MWCCMCLAGLQVGLGGELGADHTGGLDGVTQGGQHLADKTRGQRRGKSGAEQGRAEQGRGEQGRDADSRAFCFTMHEQAA